MTAEIEEDVDPVLSLTDLLAVKEDASAAPRLRTEDIVERLRGRLSRRQRLMSADSVEKLTVRALNEVFGGPVTPSRCPRAVCRAI